jgi:hypothetical protein
MDGMLMTINATGQDVFGGFWPALWTLVKIVVLVLPLMGALGALLIEQNRVEEALQVYREDLGFDPSIPRAYQHPDNVWALHGYHECLTRLGRTGEAEMVRQRLDLASARADTPIQASCACRLSTVAQ